jgi:hypothetical protein
MPETVEVAERARLHIHRPSVPSQIRPTFIRAATAGFAGFAALSVFTAVAPTFLLDLLHENDHAVSGAVVFTVFAASTLGQVAVAPRLGRWAPATGCALLILGMGVLAVGLAVGSLALLLASASIAGLGQGVGLRSGLQAVNEDAPPERRGAVASSLFIVLYLGISLPVIGEGIAATRLGLRTAGIAFSLSVAVIAAAAFATLIPARIRRKSPGRRPSARSEDGAAPFDTKESRDWVAMTPGE